MAYTGATLLTCCNGCDLWMLELQECVVFAPRCLLAAREPHFCQLAKLGEVACSVSTHDKSARRVDQTEWDGLVLLVACRARICAEQHIVAMPACPQLREPLTKELRLVEAMGKVPVGIECWDMHYLPKTKPWLQTACKKGAAGVLPDVYYSTGSSAGAGPVILSHRRL
jgi:hypothetical protein